MSKLQSKPQSQTLLLGGFALAGLLLAAIGLYGVIALLVAQRMPEIGVWMALGATPGNVRRMILSQAGIWLGAGLLLGLLAAAARKLIESLLFETTADAPLPLLAAVVALSATAMLAAWLPARRAARVEPGRALRYE